MSAKLMKPTVNVGAKKPQLAIYGHILALVAGLISVIFGILGFLDGEILGGIIGIFLAVIVVVVELDTVVIEPLKSPLIRGIAWIVLAVIGAGSGNITSLSIAIAGILYIIYHYK